MPPPGTCPPVCPPVCPLVCVWVWVWDSLSGNPGRGEVSRGLATAGRRCGWRRSPAAGRGCPGFRGTRCHDAFRELPGGCAIQGRPGRCGLTLRAGWGARAVTRERAVCSPPGWPAADSPAGVWRRPPSGSPFPSRPPCPLYRAQELPVVLQRAPGAPTGAARMSSAGRHLSPPIRPRSGARPRHRRGRGSDRHARRGRIRTHRRPTWVLPVCRSLPPPLRHSPCRSSRLLPPGTALPFRPRRRRPQMPLSAEA